MTAEGRVRCYRHHIHTASGHLHRLLPGLGMRTPLTTGLLLFCLPVEFFPDLASWSRWLIYLSFPLSAPCLFPLPITVSLFYFFAIDLLCLSLCVKLKLRGDKNIYVCPMPFILSAYNSACLTLSRLSIGVCGMNQWATSRSDLVDRIKSGVMRGENP